MDIAQYIFDHLFEIAIVVGIVVLIFVIFRKFRKTPLMPDYVKLFQKEIIAGETLNVPDKKYGLKKLYKGNVLLGKIIAFSTIPYNIATIKDIKDTNVQADKPYEVLKNPKKSTLVYSVTFRRAHNLGIKLYWGNEVLKFTEDDDFKREGDKLIFNEAVPFNSVGNHYVTMTSYPYLSRVIEDLFNKFLFHQSVNLFSGNMAKLSSIDPVFAHQLNMAKEEIKKIEAEKRMKMGNIF